MNRAGVLARLLLIGYCLYLVLPLYWLVTMAFKTNRDIVSRLEWLPAAPTLANFAEIFNNPVWLDGLRVESWNVTVSLVQSSGAPRLSVAFRQWEPHAPEGFYLPRLLVTATGPGRYFSQTLVDVSTPRVNVPDDNVNVQDADVNVEDAAVKLPDAEVNLANSGENLPAGGVNVPDADVRKRRSRTMSDSVDGDGPVSQSTELSNSEGGVLGKPGNSYAARQWQTIEFESGDGDDGLSPGNYTVLFRPADGVTFNCDGLSDGCPLLSAATVLVPKLEPAPPKPLPPRPKAWKYGLVAGGCFAVLVVGAAATCLLLRRRAGALIAGWKRVAASAVPLSPLQQQQQLCWRPALPPVLLIHGVVNSASERTALRELAAKLRAGGVYVIDGAPLRRQFLRAGSIAPLLNSNHLHSARLLFVSTGGGRGDSMSGASESSTSGGRNMAEGSVEAQIYFSAVRYVRAGHLALNYGRVFTGRLSGADARELAGLCEGRLFTLPEHAPLLLEHLTAPAAAAVEGGGSEALTAGPPSETTPLSAAAIP